MTTAPTFDPATLQSLLSTPGMMTPPQNIDLSEVQVVIWEKRWNIQAGPVRCDLECYINYAPQTQAFTFGSAATLSVVGRKITFKKEFQVTGDVQKMFDLPFNCKLQTDIHNWTHSPNQLVFDLLVRFKASVLPNMAVYQGRVSVPIPSAQEIQELCALRLDSATIQTLQQVTTLPVSVNEVYQY